MSGARRYLEGLHEAWRESGVFGYLLVAVWLLYPVAVVTVFHPSDAVGFQLWLQGFACRHHDQPRSMRAKAWRWWRS